MYHSMQVHYLIFYGCFIYATKNSTANHIAIIHLNLVVNLIFFKLIYKITSINLAVLFMQPKTSAENHMPLSTLIW